MKNRVKDILRLIKEREDARELSASLVSNVIMERLLLDNSKTFVPINIEISEKSK